MIISSLSVLPLAIFKDIDTASLNDLMNIKNISGGIIVTGPAAAYALVWELGSLRLKKPGPRTVWGINRLGERHIMSSQAPEGYVGVISDQFWPIIQKHLMGVNYGSKSLNLQLEIAVDNASQEIASMVRDLAPVGETGDLRTGIQGADSGDPTLGGSTDLISGATLIL
jgi:hypothetical protein